VNSIHDCPALQQAIEGIGRWEAVLRTRFARGVVTGTRRCPSIRQTRWLCVTDSLCWIGSHIQQIQALIIVYLEADDEELRRARRNPVLDIVADGRASEQFQVMENCLALLQPLRSLCDRREGRSATLSLVVPAVRETLDAHRDLYSARILQPSSYEILKHLLSTLIARMAMNVEDICVTPYVLSLEDSDEIRARGMGLAVAEVHSRGRDGEHPASMFDEGVRDGYVPDVSGDFACFPTARAQTKNLPKNVVKWKMSLSKEKKKYKQKNLPHIFISRSHYSKRATSTRCSGIRSIRTSSRRPTDVSEPWLRSWECRQFSQFNASTIGWK
jgi:hypothetical protein